MNTPDTEWRTHAQRADYFEPNTLVMTLDNIDLLLTYRDTYWKERVRKDYQALKETPAYVNLVTQWGQLDEDGICIGVSRQALEETMTALDKLLDNLK